MKRLTAASLTAALIAAPGFVSVGAAQTAKPSPYRTATPSQSQNQAATPYQNQYQSQSQVQDHSQDQYEGVSHPPNEPIVTDDLGSSNPYTSNSTSASASAASRPAATAPATSPASAAAAAAIHADALSGGQQQPSMQPLSAEPASSTTPTLVTRPATSAVDFSNPEYGIVTSVPAGPNQLAPGTTLTVQLNQELSSESTQPGAPFTGRVLSSVSKDGRIVIPVGSTVRGYVTSISSGRRITGGSSIHLRPDEVILPNGTQYLMHAIVYDVGPQINGTAGKEGDVVTKAHGKRTVAEAGLMGGGAAAAGFLIAGGPAALIAGGAAATYVGTRWLLQDRQAVLPKNSVVIFGLTEPMNLVPYTNRASLSSGMAGAQGQAGIEAQ